MLQGKITLLKGFEEGGLRVCCQGCVSRVHVIKHLHGMLSNAVRWRGLLHPAATENTACTIAFQSQA
jgi:hypothetical protein